MFRKLNQLNNPDWFEHGHWHREVVCMHDPFIEGDLTLFSNGDCKIGTRAFGAGVPIDDLQFAGGYTAKRRFDRPEWLIIRTPAGIHHYYRYRHVVAMWERYSPFDDPVLDRDVKRFGPRLGSLLFALRRERTDLSQAVVQALYVSAPEALGCLLGLIVLAVLAAVLAALNALTEM